MNVALALALIGGALAAQFALFCVVNALLFRAPRQVLLAPVARAAAPAVSVLIPARDEAGNIGAAIDAVLASRGIALEVLVLDDQSSDDTARIVVDYAARDPRVRLLRGVPLPAGWCGKQHACAQLAAAARGDELVFIDADVRLSPDAVARLVAARRHRGVALLSGIPHQITGSLLETLVIPLIHVVLLGYLPFPGLRWTRRPAFAAACGQLVVVAADAYRTSGGHGAIRASWHDGLALPRHLRACGHGTDLVDVTALARCRMYRGARETWEGFAKNAAEGLGSPRGIVPWTLLLLGGHVLPALLFVIGLLADWPPAVLGAAAAGSGVVLAARVLLAWRYRHPPLSVLLFPVGAALLVAIQWHARLRRHRGWRPRWKGRTQHVG
jgi:hypothetical protein